MNPNRLIAIVLLSLVAAALIACSPTPQAVTDAWQAALNKGDVDAALAYLADDAAVTIIPPVEGDGIYQGLAEIRTWYDTIAANRGTSTYSNCSTSGETTTCLVKYEDEGLRSMGVDFLEGEWVAIIRDGKIQSYTNTISPESLAKFPPPPEPTPSPEMRLTALEPIVGNWVAKSEGYSVFHGFASDGSLTVNVSGVGVISTGKYWFEDELLKIEDLNGDCQNIVGSYETYITYQADKPILLRFILVGEDACTTRKDTLAGNTMSHMP